MARRISHTVARRGPNGPEAAGGAVAGRWWRCHTATMARAGSGMRSVLLAAVLIMSTIGVGALVADATPAAAQDDRTHTRYSVDTANAGIDVVTTFDAGRMRDDLLFLALPATAESLVARTSAGVELPLVPDGPVIDGDFWAYWVLDLTGAGDEMAELRYVLPSDAPRSSGYTRVNAAHIEFYLVPDPAFGAQSISVELPVGFRADLGAAYPLFRPGVGENGGELWRIGAVDFDHYPLPFTARNEAGLVRETVRVGGRSVQIAAWADDAEWQDFAREQVRDGVPVLARLIGSGWPEDDLVVIESTAPYNNGAGGWFLYFESEIEVGDFLHADTMLHELAHAWFNTITIDDRWMLEGLAELYSSLALAEMTGDDAAEPDPPGLGAGTTGISRWATGLDDPAIGEYYNTAWYVFDEIYDEIGQERFQAVVQAMLDGTPSYATDASSATRPRNDWRRLLDLFEEVGGSDRAGELFTAHVVPPDRSQLLAARRDVRAAYAELKELSLPLAVPAAVRGRLGAWKFEEASLLIDDAHDAALRLAGVRERADALGLELPPSLVRAYEDAEFSLDPLGRQLDGAEAALDALEAAGPDAENAATARLRFERGRFDEVVDATGGLAGTASTDSGGLSVVVIVVAAFAVLLFMLVMGRAVRAGSAAGARY